MHDRQVVNDVQQVLQGDVHLQIDPDKTYPVIQVRQVVNDVQHVLQGDVHVHVEPESTFPVTQVRHVVAVV